MQTKRAVDVILGTVLALVALPLIVVLGIGCAVSLRARPLFVQRRVGRNGRTFLVAKLRTLPRRAPSAVDKYQLDQAAIPAFCRLLRRTHLDELPQLFAVPFGRMSLVGPRPEMPQLIERYPAHLAALRGTMRPGCTGLWQISRASQGLIYEAPEYDIAYVRNCGFRLDAWILCRTMWMGLTHRTIELSDVPRWALRDGLAAPAVSRPVGPMDDLRRVVVMEPSRWSNSGAVAPVARLQPVLESTEDRVSGAR